MTASKEIVRVFIGSSPSEWLPAKVLEHSIRRNTSAQVEVHRLYESKIAIPMPRNKKNRPRTPFSFQRFLIPEICNYQGNAIYLDADMLVFADIKELWDTDLSGKDVLAVQQQELKSKPQFSVMLMNTENLLWNIAQIVESLDKGIFTYDQLMYDFAIAKATAASLHPSWNSLEKYTEETKLLHYTNMHLQPWVSVNNPHRDIWVNELFLAIQNNYISISEVKHEITNDYIRPSLMTELFALIQGKSLPNKLELERIDVKFKAPFQALAPNQLARLYAKTKIVINRFLR